jgi:CDP-2,3-bis-(O-geranylgeranyl)-sn-glycerol synthase
MLTFNDEFLWRIILYLLPLYVTNASALVFGGGLPLDLNKTIGNKPILGKGKTFRGTIAALLAGFLTVILINALLGSKTALLTKHYLYFGFLLCVGAVLGDIVASFFKRRLGLKQGHSVPLLDQLDFVAGGILLTLHIVTPSVLELLVMVGLTVVVHRGSNIVAYKLKLKKVPW